MKLHRDGDKLLQLLIFNEECLVSASHQLALITSLPFVHTARRSYRLDVLVKRLDWRPAAVTLSVAEKFVKPSHLEEGEVVTRFSPDETGTPRLPHHLPKPQPPERVHAATADQNNERAERASQGRPPLATPSNCGEAHPTLEHQAARRTGARGRGNDPGFGNSVESRSPIDRAEVGHPQPSPEPAATQPPCRDAVHRLDGGGSPGSHFSRGGGLRYSRAHPAMGRVD